MPRALTLIVVCLAAVACGPKKPSRADLEAARQRAEIKALAESRMLQGCYDCLLDAKAAYTRLATGADRPEMLARLFEIELLIALREKELALDSASSIAHARELSAQLPDPPSAARYLRAVEAVLPDSTGLSEARIRAFRRTTLEYVQTLDAEIAWMLGDSSLQQPVRHYIALAIDCSYYRRARPVARPAAPGQPVPAAPARQVVRDQIPKDAPDVLQYRVAICDDIRRAPLEMVRKNESRWAEAAYFLARVDVARAQDTGASAARPLLADAYARFPKSPAITYLNANYNQLIGDCKEALRFYDETVAIEPEHDNGLLGRTVCLAFLKRFDESIASATRMISIPTANLTEPYYWRAWVRHYLQDLTNARADIETAKKMAFTNDVHRLAGMIEYDQNELDMSFKDLTTAKSMYGGKSDCVASWYIGLVEMKRERWTESADAFVDAMRCYESASTLASDALKKTLAADNMDPDFKARQIAGFEAAIKEDTSQQYASAFNAANHYARAGNVARARALLEIAAKDEALAARVAELRKILGGG